MSDMAEVFYGGKKFGESAVHHEEDIGPQVIHIYEVNDLPLKYYLLA